MCALTLFLACVCVYVCMCVMILEKEFVGLFADWLSELSIFLLAGLLV